MVIEFGKSFQEMKLEKDDKLNPGSILVVENISDLLDVKVNIDSGFLG